MHFVTVLFDCMTLNICESFIMFVPSIVNILFHTHTHTHTHTHRHTHLHPPTHRAICCSLKMVFCSLQNIWLIDVLLHSSQIIIFFYKFLLLLEYDLPISYYSLYLLLEYSLGVFLSVDNNSLLVTL